MEDNATSPVEPDVAPAEQVEATEPEVIEPQLDENGEPVPVKRSIKFIDHEIDLPETVDEATAERLAAIGKELEAGATRKFQTAAEERRAAEAIRARAEAQEQALNVVFQEAAELRAIDQQLSSYRDAQGNEFTPMQWAQWAQQDPQAAQAAFMQYQALQNHRAAIAQRFEAKKKDFIDKRDGEQLARFHEGQRVLQEKIPEWSPATQQRIADYAQKALGVKPEELARVMDPGLVLAIHESQLYRQSLEKAKAKPATPQPQPVQKVGSVAPTSKTPDKMSMNEWLEWREKDLRRKGR